ncbi:hypothetical protein [Alteriqipengyuania lutimaris]|uniref:Uncharacterized protein n=1 Tax=Alteriqipengyuania lutimaris TaxID=1538146 RepID=A0A395LIT4_9SPHN|nr:hypothetical protein [Alteriqipengyuania lutimaris]MBB3034279.1 hypothetical protein [Alteriqipengyuania lutimaris]RDS76812.1 hypothetical protein DL238_03765 [Alteriqipengyuania lutimaris]
MHKFSKIALALALVPLVAACATPAPPNVPQQGTGRAPPRTVPIPPADPRPAAPGAFIAPRVMNVAGLEYVIGSRARQLEQIFGPARLDVLEGDARKLQFVGEQCVLDVFLYPLAPGAEPTATYVEARRASDALDVDRVACAQALRR